MDTKMFEIISGPNKDILFDACKYAYSRIRIPIDFTVAIGYTQPMDNPKAACLPMAIKDIQITMIEHEDGSGESLNLSGYCKADLYSIAEDYTAYKFNAYYNTKTRKGTISFL